MFQPTVNQIESAYQLQPQKLGQKVEQDKKQNGGLPKDLRQLMAFNDIAEGRQNMGIQQALQAPTNMPTVAQSIQERARPPVQPRRRRAGHRRRARLLRDRVRSRGARAVLGVGRTARVLRRVPRP